MFNTPSNLPSDVAELQAIIALRDAEIETRDRKLSIFAAEIQERDYRIEKLKHELAGLRRHRFGSRSEALDQLELTLEEEEIARAAATPPCDDDKANQTNGEKRKPRRKPLPEHLHRNDQVLFPGEACNACGGSCVDAPLDANVFFGDGGACGQVRSCVRPLRCGFPNAAGPYGDMQIGTISLTRARWRIVRNAGSPDPVS